MQFFRIEGLITDEKWREENNDRRAMRECTGKIAVRSGLFNQKLNGKSFWCVANASEDKVTIGVICCEAASPEKRLAVFLKAVGLTVSDILIEEITLSSMRDMLNCAERNDYIEDADDVLRRFDLDKIASRYRLDYGENVIEKANRNEIYKAADGLLARESVVAELDRIFSGKQRKNATGHPVHYFVETDDHDTRREIYRLLLRALYSNGRLRNKRYCFLDFAPGESVSSSTYDCLYKSCVGGAVIARYLADEDAESDYASCGRETIEILTETMKKYRNQVLTVFCLPRECAKSKQVFCENLGSICFVELKEEFVSGERAESYLKMLAKENSVRTDKRLFDGLEEGKGYLAPQLQEIFDKWYYNKLRNDVYPQYKDTVSAKNKILKAAPKGSAYDELTEMIGIGEAKKVINQALNYYKAQKLFADRGMTADEPAMHMVFTGNPGTAKTTVARLFARIMRDNGLLSKGEIIEVGRGDLVGKYVGWTAPRIQRKFRDAQGGVLFIDEAYSLVDDRDGSFGDEAINTIVQEMENHREDVVVIFAGYPDKMEKFLQKNPGLRSRIAFHVPFADYETDELCGIADLIAKKKGLILSEGARGKLTGIFDAARRESDFGNGRYVRNVIEKAKMAQATRLLGMDYDLVAEEDVVTIRAEDIEIPASAKNAHNPIGFRTEA